MDPRRSEDGRALGLLSLTEVQWRRLHQTRWRDENWRETAMCSTLWDFRSSILGITVLLVGVFLTFAAPQDEGHHLVKRKKMAFCMNVVACTKWLALETDGTYKLITLSDEAVFGVDGFIRYGDEEDHGRWWEDRDGAIVLDSSVLWRRVYTGGAVVVTRGDRNVAAREWFANHLAEFLARERKQRYSYDEFQTACTRTHTISESGKSSKTSFRFVAEREAAVTRQEAEELLEAWREFIKSDVKGRLHVALASHRGLTFLVSKEAPWIPVFSLERQRRVVERRASGAQGLFLQMEYQDYEREMAHTRMR